MDPGEVAAASSLILTSLPDGATVAAVARSLAAHAQPGTVIVDTSTIAPVVASALAKELGRDGVTFLDAPVSGGPSAAAAGALSIMVGGETAGMERASALLRELGDTVIHCGPPGAGQTCKACNQLIVMGTIELVAEALVLADRSGLDPWTVRRALLGGYAASAVLDVHGERMLRRDFAPGGRARFNLKDISILGALSAAAGVPLPAFEVAAARVKALIDGGGGDLDNAALIEVLRSDSRAPMPDQTPAVRAE
jgi:2-hydroxy-3-oxopropionate reductase